MNLKMAEFLVDLGVNSGQDCSLRENYSGRGMYGKTTTGVACEDPLNLMAAALSTVVEDPDIAEDLDFEVESLSQDSMGLQAVIY